MPVKGKFDSHFVFTHLRTQCRAAQQTRNNILENVKCHRTESICTSEWKRSVCGCENNYTVIGNECALHISVQAFQARPSHKHASLRVIAKRKRYT